jgi:hypothetical protein
MSSPGEDDIPRPVTVEWVAYRYRDLHRRVNRIEAQDEKSDPAVLAERVKLLGDDVRSLKRAFYTFAFSVVGSAVVFAFTVFALRGGG